MTRGGLNHIHAINPPPVYASPSPIGLIMVHWYPTTACRVPLPGAPYRNRWKEPLMLSLGFFAWIVIGGLAGWLGSKIMGTDEQQGLLMNIVVGVIGGLIGGMILGLVFDVESAGWFFSFLTCLLGSVILLWVVKKLTGSKS